MLEDAKMWLALTPAVAAYPSDAMKASYSERSSGDGS
jgi:hypothetical protein